MGIEWAINVVTIAIEGDCFGVEGGVAMSEAANVSEFMEQSGKQVIFPSSGGIGFGLEGAACQGGKFTPVQGSGIDKPACTLSVAIDQDRTTDGKSGRAKFGDLGLGDFAVGEVGNLEVNV